LKEIFLNFLSLYNKIFSSHIWPYLLFFNFLLILYLFVIAFNGFFRVIIAFIFLFNLALFIGFFDIDFFTALMLGAEFPILLILLIFYFQKNSLQIDNIYKYLPANLGLKYFYTGLLIIFIYLYNNNLNFIFFHFYNFILNTTYSLSSRNDFLVIYIIYYKINSLYIYLFAVLIFFVSLLIIFLFQINKIYHLKTTKSFKNVLILRKQNILRQGVFNSKLKFFNKKINKNN